MIVTVLCKHLLNYIKHKAEVPFPVKSPSDLNNKKKFNWSIFKMVW